MLLSDPQVIFCMQFVEFSIKSEWIYPQVLSSRRCAKEPFMVFAYFFFCEQLPTSC